MPRLIPLLAAAVLASASLVAPPARADEAEAERLLHELERLTQKSHWKGVDRVYARILEEKAKHVPARAHRAGGDAARQQGNATEAQRRYLRAERLEPTAEHEELDQYRTAYGVLEIRRVEATCITLTPAERPFDPTKAAAIDFAAEALKDAGAFRGLVPIGRYTVGSYPVEITPGMKPSVVQRVPGDSDCS